MSSLIRKWAVCSAVWLVLLTIGTFLYMNRYPESGFSSQNDVAQASDYAYITDNGATEGLVYQMDGEDITAFFHTNSLSYLENYSPVKVAISDENPYVVFEQKKNDGGREVTSYTIVEFNTQLQPIAISPSFRFDLPITLTGLSVTDERIYLTSLAENRRMVYVSSISTSDLATIETTALSGEDVSKWEKLSLTLSEVTSESSEDERFYAQANYVNGALVVCYDNETNEAFSVDSDIASAFQNKKLSIPQRLICAGVSIPVVLILLFSGVLLILVLLVVLHKKRRIVYQIAFTETVFLIGIAALYLVSSLHGKETLEEGYRQWASLSAISVFDGYELSDLSGTSIYSGSDYQVLADRLMRIASFDYDNSFSTVAVDVISNEDRVILSADGQNLKTVSDKYGADASSLMTSCISTASVRAKWGSFGGKRAYYVAVPLSRAGLNGYGALIVAESNPSTLYQTASVQKMGVMLLLFFIVISGGILALFLAQNRDLTSLQEALGALSRGETEIQKPTVIGRDMHYIWNSIFEIQKNILHINREKLLTYEAYFKFAPKGVEKVLGLSSMTDIRGGEHVKRSGTLAILSLSGRTNMSDRDMEHLSVLYADLESCRENYNGLYVSHTNSFDFVKYLFLEKEKSTVEFGVEYVQKIRQERGKVYGSASFFLCYTPFSYGVVGVKEQASIYLNFPHSRLFDQLSAWFREMRLELVITQSVKDHERPEASLRYIGFVMPTGGTQQDAIRLYEVLDALSSDTRYRREDTLADFDEGLRLFYERNFYLARNIFSDILRKAPEDEISKWYLFECEKYLDEVVPDDFIGALHME